jgi:hypothetical protein
MGEEQGRWSLTAAIPLGQVPLLPLGQPTQIACTVDYSEQPHCITLDVIDDSIVAEQDLTECVPPKLRDSAAKARVCL